MAKRIVSFFPVHTCYVEPFFGAGWVLFEKTPSQHEIINDINGDLMIFWNVVKTQADALYESMKWDIPSRQIHENLRQTNPESLSDIERARRVYWLTKGSFGGIYSGVFGTGRASPNRLAFNTFEARLKATNMRLKKVTIECKDYRRLARTYDHATTLWYCDPPYFETRKSGYVADIDLREFSEFCKSLKGKVAVSHMYNETVAELFRNWNFIELGEIQICTANNGRAETRGQKSREWLITNYQL